MWQRELEELHAEYTKHREQLRLANSGTDQNKKITKKVIIKKKKAV
jgi:hypothetical protein